MSEENFMSEQALNKIDALIREYNEELSRLRVIINELYCKQQNMLEAIAALEKVRTP